MATGDYVIKVDIGAVDKLLQKYGREELGKRTRAAMNEALSFLQGEVEKRTPEGASGLLRQSITSELRGTPMNLSGRVFSGGIPYARWAEQGRAPGKFPPRGPIELWAKRVLGDATLWFVVARSIARKGTKGAFMFRDAWRAGKGKIKAIFQRRILRGF